MTVTRARLFCSEGGKKGNAGERKSKIQKNKAKVREKSSVGTLSGGGENDPNPHPKTPEETRRE